MKTLHIMTACFLFFSHGYAGIERRAAIDVGSGGTKIIVADVNTKTNQIEEVLFNSTFSVPYQASLDKSIDGTFDEETKALSLKTFQEIQAITAQFEVQKIAAVATSAFRKANNSQALVQDIEQQTRINIRIIPQREEGEIAFFSAAASYTQHIDDIIVWDIGTGSLQMTTVNTNGGLSVYMGEQMGSVSFKSYIIDTIQESELEDKTSPNPISDEDLKMADRYARAFGRKAYPIIKQKIQANGKVVGMGRLFYHGIRLVASEDNVITRQKLREFIDQSLNKKDEDLNNPFAHVDVSNCILTLAIMKALHIHEIYPVETTSAHGILLSPNYW